MCLIVMSATNFCFTIFEPLIAPPYPLPENFTYLSYQWEICPSTKRAHIQGFCQTDKKIRPSSVSKQLFSIAGRHPHVEIMKGTAQQARDYSMKEETRMPETTPFSVGSFRSGQGARMDLSAVARLCEERKPLKGIAKEHPVAWIRYHRGIESLHTTLADSADPMRSTFGMVYIWGPSGCGKTSAVRRRWPDAYWMTETTRGWMDSYAGQGTIVIDDFAAVLPLPWVLRLCQPQPFEAERKGQAPVAITATTVVLTANFPPEEQYVSEKNQSAFLSRLSVHRNGFVIYCTDGASIDWPDLSKTIVNSPVL